MSDRELSRTAATRRGVHARLAELDAGRAPDFDPGRTLRLRVEFARQLRRRRTQIVFGLLIVLPVIIAIAFQVGGGAGSGAPQLVSLATAGGYNFAVFTEFAAVGFLLVVVVALFCGDTVASEASWSSLRYLLAQPVPRSRLLRQKIIVAGLMCVAANLLLPIWSFVVGGLFFGWAPARSPVGGTFDFSQSWWRMLVIVGYVCIQLATYASLAFLLSVSVDNPLGAVGGAVMLAVISSILDQITALDPYRHYLPSHFNAAWVDVLSSPVRWDDMIRGSGLSLIYTAVFLGYAWVRFDRKDITS
ncbi:ABC transporter permease [uncultured Jatrophihabitans sp.]|uniref:ABC transporter permease n=1 Tax=uncultured Jatrophihabitans sp. TaxID=1610747 RepID=UPI0035C964A0